MARVHVVRRIAADPTSTALLLSGPTALELWPGVRRVGDEHGHVLVEAALPVAADAEPPTAAATVRALPPRRTPTSFVIRFDFTGDGVPRTAGELTLAAAPGSGSGACTEADLRLDYVPATGRAALAGHRAGGVLRAMAEGFLRNLADAAERRSHAA